MGHVAQDAPVVRTKVVCLIICGAAETVRWKRWTLVNAANFAVDTGELRELPITAVRWQKPKASNQVDPRVVANPEQARNLLASVFYAGGYRRARGRRLVGLFAAMYFGGLRPAEAVGLVENDLVLFEHGWGSAVLHRTCPSVRKQWTDSGGDPRRPRDEEPAD